MALTKVIGGGISADAIDSGHFAEGTITKYIKESNL
jgi:hypothetical protein